MILKIVQNFFILLINVYQRTLSPDHGWFKSRHPYGFCRFYPSCSEYAKQSLKTHGLFKGIWLSFKRILRCNPWVQPAADPIPALK